MHCNIYLWKSTPGCVCRELWVLEREHSVSKVATDFMAVSKFRIMCPLPVPWLFFSSPGFPFSSPQSSLHRKLSSSTHLYPFSTSYRPFYSLYSDILHQFRFIRSLATCLDFEGTVFFFARNFLLFARIKLSVKWPSQNWTFLAWRETFVFLLEY